LKSREISLFSPRIIRSPVKRLPYYTRIKWQDAINQIVEREARHATVADIKKFTTAKARAASHQIIGNIASESKSKQLFNNQRTRRPKVNRFSAHRKPKILNPQTRNPSSLCVMLIIGYHIANPLGKGHFVHSCKKKRFCKARGCTSKHSTFLHSCTK